MTRSLGFPGSVHRQLPKSTDLMPGSSLDIDDSGVGESEGVGGGEAGGGLVPEGCPLPCVESAVTEAVGSPLPPGSA
ncbi:hypothetical protein V6K52_12605 [Knoellia sp. S7-12]|uniref:hypothetical protein n=1 Tax=Knoellia sp. S7-12 TaxID=3126698 RepID=UPI003368F3E3